MRPRFPSTGPGASQNPDHSLIPKHNDPIASNSRVLIHDRCQEPLWPYCRTQQRCGRPRTASVFHDDRYSRPYRHAPGRQAGAAACRPVARAAGAFCRCRYQGDQRAAGKGPRRGHDDHRSPPVRSGQDGHRHPGRRARPAAMLLLGRSQDRRAGAPARQRWRGGILRAQARPVCRARRRHLAGAGAGGARTRLRDEGSQAEGRRNPDQCRRPGVIRPEIPSLLRPRRSSSAPSS